MPWPGRPPNPPPREFYVFCWRCQQKIFLAMGTERPLTGEDLTCLACSAHFVIRKRKPAAKPKRKADA